MLNPISSQSTYVQQTALQPTPAKQTAGSQAAPPPEDTVELSSAAQAALSGGNTGAGGH